MTRNNPNGANQFIADPRQSLFIGYYFDQKSDTFANGLQSALKAGYDESYAEIITARMPKWLSDKVSDMSLLNKAVKNINKVLDMDNYEDIRALAIQSDMSKFVASRIGKDRFSERKELTGAEGKDLSKPNEEEKTQAIQALNAL